MNRVPMDPPMRAHWRYLRIPLRTKLSNMQKLVKIYGERNTCSRYLRRLIELNLDVGVLEGGGNKFVQQLQEALPGRELVRDISAYLSYRQDLGWKHSNVKKAHAIRKKTIFRHNKIIFLTLTKNPYAWLLSLHRRPYHQYYEKKPDFINFLQTPWKTLHRENVRGELRSPIELWNTKNKSYIDLHSSDLDSLKITSEKLLESPELVIDQIKSNFSVSRKSIDFINHDDSTKETESNSITRDAEKDTSYYRDYYLNEKWKEKLSPAAIEIINASLDETLMDYFGYKFL